MKSKRLAQGIALHAAMGIVVVICVFPVLWSCVDVYKRQQRSCTFITARPRR